MKVKAGAHYYNGWMEGSAQITERLVKEFPEREPIWGWVTSTPEIMQRQIDCAADAGLAFFSFCWYYPEAEEKATPYNNAMPLFLAAPNSSRMEFCLLVANHQGFRIGPGDWDECCRRWLPLLKHPRHLKVGGEPLLLIFSPSELDGACSGAKGVRKAFADLRTRAQAEGLPGVAIAACVTPDEDLRKYAAAGYTCFTGYNYYYKCGEGPDKDQPFACLLQGHERIWEEFAAHSPLPYIPLATIGWDMRPWEKPDLPEKDQCIRFIGRTPAMVGEMAGRMAAWVDRHPDKTLQERLAILYAWNENGEGGYLTPTKAEGDACLQAVRKALTWE